MFKTIRLLQTFDLTTANLERRLLQRNETGDTFNRNLNICGLPCLHIQPIIMYNVRTYKNVLHTFKIVSYSVRVSVELFHVFRAQLLVRIGKMWASNSGCRHLNKNPNKLQEKNVTKIFLKFITHFAHFAKIL